MGTGDGETQRMRGWASAAARVAACAGWIGLMAGCVRTQVESSVAGVVTEGDMNAELGFWEAIGSRAVVSNDEALHGLLLFADGSEASGSYEERVKAARKRGWLEAGWDEPWYLGMQRGVLARVVAVHCEIKGGVMMHVLGPTPRYATRELQYLGIMGVGSEQQAVSGREFMGVLSKAQDYLLLQEAEEQDKKAGEAAGAEPGDEGDEEMVGEGGER